MHKLETKLPRGGQRVIHGGYSFLTTGQLPEHRTYIRRYLTNCREGLLQDLGGEPNLSTQQVMLIDRIISKLGCLRCIEEHVRENSVMVGQRLAPSLRTSYLAFSNSLRLDLQALGIKKRTASGKTALEEIVAEYDKEKYGKSEKSKAES